MKLLQRTKTYLSEHNQSIYIYLMAFLCLAMVMAELITLLFHAKDENPEFKTEVTNSNVLKPDEIKKLSALMTSDGKDTYKILPLPAPTEKKVIKPSNSRCNYNGQDYLPGDIVKTDQGWVRCTPTLIFNSERAENRPGSPAWIAVQ